MEKNKASTAEGQVIAQLRHQEQMTEELFLSASHQLKSPVTVIQWCLQAALDSTKLKGKEREMVDRAMRQATGMGQLIKEILEVFRFSRNGSIALNRILVTPLIDVILENCAPLAEHRSVVLVKGPLEQDAAIMAQDTYINQIIYNLLDNAIRYSSKGGKVEVSVEIIRGKVRISISDQGIGIAPADQERIFSEFFRSSEARAFAPEGTGLGLTLVQKVVEEFGGAVTVDSKLGKGSTFALVFPAA